ncbi:MAG: ABC transporter ATP-binding protein [Oscillospiraceae bacterium]|nr:ABC transporter ATP-binding protein [Oscillospiraceae bacterium]
MKKHTFFGIGLIRPYLQPYRWELLGIVLLSGLGSLIDIGVPLFQRYALDRYVAEGELRTLPVFAAVYLGAILAAAVFNYFACIWGMKVEVGVDRDLRDAAFSHLQTLSFSYFNQNSVGYIHSRVMSDTQRIGELLSWTLLNSAWQLCYVIGAVVAMFVIRPGLAWAVTAILPVVALLYAVFQRRLFTLNREIREQNARITGDFNEGIMGARTIKTLVIEEKQADRFRKGTETMRRKSLSAARYHGLFAATMSFASSLALALVLWRGGVIAKEQIGTFSMFMSYALGLMEPVRWVVDAIGNLITTQINIERLDKLLRTSSDVVDRAEVLERYGDSFSPKRENWEPLRGDIEFRDVSFRYPDGEDLVLEHFSLKIPFGTNLAIVGETGAGKSTLANLICRFYEPTEGALLVDGRDARERSQLWLRSSIACVLQTPHLFSGSIRDNLLYGNPSATEEEIRAALDLVSASELVDGLPQGLDTDVGESGDLLSTGEKQLISFARAILADPRILILDEATASVDTLTERKIQSAIDRIIRGRTSVVIAHRLSTVRDADVILVVNDGKIVERGKHAELMEKRGTYYRLYTRQYEEEATGAALGGPAAGEHA